MILITGCSGFIGRNLVKKLEINDKYQLVLASRTRDQANKISKYVKISDINKNTNWSTALEKVDVVIHLAGIAHVEVKAQDDISKCYEINTHGTVNLALQSAQKGVKRFVFISSIGVNGEFNDEPFTAFDIPNPGQIYAKSKLAAENEIKSIGKQYGMEIVIIRPPLVYGELAPGNFKKILNLVWTGLPLPFGKMQNLKSFVYIGNLIDLINVCIDNPKASDQIFLVSDGRDISTTCFLEIIVKGMKKNNLIFSVPILLLTQVLHLLGKKKVEISLCRSLQVDIEHTKTTLNWNPPYSLEIALSETAKAYAATKIG